MKGNSLYRPPAAAPALPPLLLDRPQAARALAVSLRTLDSLTADGTLPSLQVGKRRRYAIRALEEWIAQQSAPRPAPAAAQYGNQAPGDAPAAQPPASDLSGATVDMQSTNG